MPLCTILTEWPDPSGPMYVTHGPVIVGADRVRIDPRSWYDSVNRPGIIDSLTAPFLATADAHAEEVESCPSRAGLAAAGVVEVGIAPVDDHVAGFEQRGELVDDRSVPGRR